MLCSTHQDDKAQLWTPVAIFRGVKTLNKQDILADYIAQELLTETDGVTLAPEDDLLTTGLIDSLGIMRLVTFIEEEFGTDVPPEDIVIENFLTITHISNYLHTRNGN